jgi:outer membrane protein W
MKRTTVLLATIAMCVATSVPASAGETGWHLRIFAAGFDPDLDETVPAVNPEVVHVTADSDLGYGFSLEYQFSGHWGLEAGFMKGSPSVEFRGDIPGYGEIVLSDTMPTTALSLDIDFHLIPNNRVFDVFLGAGIVRMSYHDLLYDIEEIEDTLGVRVGSDTTWSIKAGLDIALGGSSWSATAGLRYIDSKLLVSNTDDATGETESFGFDVIDFTVGIAYRF